MKLVIKYHAQSDTLWLGNSETASDGEDIAENVIVFFRDDRPVAVHIDHAAELLGPILAGRADYPAVKATANPPSSPAVEIDCQVVETAPNLAVEAASSPAVAATDNLAVEAAAEPVGE